MRVRSYVTALLGIIVLGISAQAQAEQQPEFRLKTYGMVCNQCAYGVEQSLQHTKGVKDVIVDLRSGDVTVIPDPSNPPSAEILAQRITDQRISISNIEATLVGRLVRTPDGWQLVIGSQRLSLETAVGSPALEQYADQTVVVEGVFAGIPGVDGAEGLPRFILRAVRGSVS